jgi:hypothetical protein
MKKLIILFFILVVGGVFSSPVIVHAVYGTCWSEGKVIGKSPGITPAECASTGTFLSPHKVGVWQDDGTPVPHPPDGPAAGATPYNKGTCWYKGSAIGSYPNMTPKECSSKSGEWQDEGKPVPPSPNGPAGGVVPPGGAVLNPVITPINTDCGSNYRRIADGTCVPIEETDPTYYLLAPISTDKENVLLSFDPTGENALGKYLNLMIKIVIGLAAVMAVVMIVIGGMEYATSELISSKEAGKQRIQEALLGLLVALGAYTLLNTINPDLLKTDLKNVQSVTVNVDLDTDVPQSPVGNQYKDKFGNYLNGADWEAVAGANTPIPSWLKVKDPQCKTIGEHNCTSVRDLNLSEVEKIHSGCPLCDITITEGTAFWLHKSSTSHGRQSSTVDLRQNDTLNKYLSGGKPLVNGQRYPEKGGAYLWETDHWHVGP